MIACCSARGMLTNKAVKTADIDLYSATTINTEIKSTQANGDSDQ